MVKKDKDTLKKIKKIIISKRILKPTRTTLTIQDNKPAEYVSRYFTKEMEEAKKSLFFS